LVGGSLSSVAAPVLGTLVGSLIGSGLGGSLGSLLAPIASVTAPLFGIGLGSLLGSVSSLPLLGSVLNGSGSLVESIAHTVVGLASRVVG
jgi:hypothetical protein